MSPDPRIVYQSKADTAKLESNRIRKLLNLYSLVRLVLFALAIFLLVLWHRTGPVFAVLSSLSAFVLFLVAVKLGSGLSSRNKLLGQLIMINEEEIRALAGDYKGFQPGTEYSDQEHGYSSDLDVFGEYSLFQYLNRTGTSRGRDQLAGWLGRASPSDEIISRQAAVSELAEKNDWRQVFLATGRMSGEAGEDYARLQEWMDEKPFLRQSRIYLVLLWSLPPLTILCTFLSFRWIPYNVPVFLVLVQLGIVGLNLRRINHHHNQLSRKYNLIDRFSSLIFLIEQEEFQAEYLKRLLSDLASSGIRAGKQLKYLARLVMQFDRRLNMIMGVVLNGLLMWDLQCMLRLEKWKAANAVEVPGWFGILGKFEALNSLANFKFNHPDAVFPEPGSGNVIIQAESLGHPLIPPAENIRNDLKISKPGEFMLITGSNMAGKSTFLRTVGVNVVLAGAGAPVIASKMTWSPLRMLTSMRVRDSLNSRESTFYAELKRLRMILDVLKTGEKVLVILDEILKGTNSRDKHFGSEMFIRQLIREGSMGLIATHDLELSMLEEEFPGKVLNYCFEVQIEEEEFIYDYKLRRGVCQTLNATELMKKMGISVNGKN